MISANELRNLPKENEFLKDIEQRIIKAHKEESSSITIEVGSWNEKDWDKVKWLLKEKGFTWEIGGASGWTSYYYRISW